MTRIPEDQGTKTPRQGGYALLDVILSATLVLGIIAGAVVLFYNANIVSRTTETAQAITTASSELRGIFRTQGDFSDLGATYDLGTDRVLELGVMPDNLVLDTLEGSEIITPFGGESSFRFRTNPTDSTRIDIEISNIPGSACSRLALDAANNSGSLGPEYSVVADCSDPGTPVVATFGL